MSFLTHFWIPPTNPVYVRVMGGYSQLRYTVAYLPSNFRQGVSIKSSGMCANVSLGYDFTRYIGIEIGVGYLHRPKVTGLPGANKPQYFHHNLVYFVAKFTLPLYQRWAFYVKAGGGYVAREGITIHHTTVLPFKNVGTSIVGAGVIYQLTTHWWLDGGWLHAPSNTTQQLPTANFYGVGIIYRFRF